MHWRRTKVPMAAAEALRREDGYKGANPAPVGHPQGSLFAPWFGFPNCRAARQGIFLQGGSQYRTSQNQRYLKVPFRCGTTRSLRSKKVQRASPRRNEDNATETEVPGQVELLVRVQQWLLYSSLGIPPAAAKPPFRIGRILDS